MARGPSLVKHGVATLVLRRFRFRLQYFHTARAPRANPSGKLVVLRTMEDGRTAFLLPFCCQSSKVSPPRRVSPTAHRPCMPLSCPASPPASRALRACFPVRPRLRVHRTVHSCARPGRHFPGSPDRHAGSPSATTHDITCAFVMRNSENSSLTLTDTGAQAADLDFHDGPRMSKIDYFFGSGLRTFCVPRRPASIGALLSWVRAKPAPPWPTDLSSLLPPMPRAPLGM